MSKGDGSLPIIKLRKSPSPNPKLQKDFSNKGLNTVDKNRAKSVNRGKYYGLH